MADVGYSPVLFTRIAPSETTLPVDHAVIDTRTGGMTISMRRPLLHEITLVLPKKGPRLNFRGPHR